MVLSKILLVSAIFASPANTSIEKNADGTLSITSSYPKGTPEGKKWTYLADEKNTTIVIPSAVLTEAGVKSMDYVLEACGKSFTDSSLSPKERLNILDSIDETCTLKLKRRGSTVYVSLKNKNSGK